MPLTGPETALTATNTTNRPTDTNTATRETHMTITEFLLARITEDEAEWQIA